MPTDLPELAYGIPVFPLPGVTLFPHTLMPLHIFEDRYRNLMEDTLLNRTKCPVKLADMLAVGVPVVAEAVGQVTEYVVSGRTGTTFPTGDITGITQELIHILQNPERQAQLSAGAKAHIAANFSWEHLAARLLPIYKH